RDLCGRGILPLRDPDQQVDECTVRLARLRVREARDRIAEVAALERRRLVDLPGQEAPTKWTERDEADPELLERREDRILRFPPPQRVLALKRGHRLDRVGAADCLHAGLGEAEVLDLALLDQFLDGACDVFDRDVRVDAVLVEEVDRVGAQAPQRIFDASRDRLRTAVGAAGLIRREVEAELGRDHDPVTYRLERLADELLVRERAVALRRVEERDAAVDSRPDQGDHLLLLREWRKAGAHAHAAEPERRYLQVLSERALVHRVLLAGYELEGCGLCRGFTVEGKRPVRYPTSADLPTRCVFPSG